jgi:hypothetical protein
MFLPWLGLRHTEEVAGVKFVPRAEYLSSGRLSSEERSWLDGYFNRYQGRNGQPSCALCVATSDDADISRQIRIVRATAAAFLVYRHAEAYDRGNGTMLPARAESWLWHVQRFDPAKTEIAVTEGYVTKFLGLDDFRDLTPWEWVDGVYKLDDPVRKMAEALVFEAEGDEDFGVALELLTEGFMTSTRHVTRLNLILAGSALELLAQPGSGRSKAEPIAEAFVRAIRRASCGYPAASNELDRTVTAARQADAELVRLWMTGCENCDRRACTRHRAPYVGFYRRRNKVIHEGVADADLLRHQRPDTGERHQWQVGGPGFGAHSADVALTMTGWLMLDRVGARLASVNWHSWCRKLDAAMTPLGMGRPRNTDSVAS